jgi:regulator of RNase E activity RraB
MRRALVLQGEIMRTFIILLVLLSIGGCATKDEKIKSQEFDYSKSDSDLITALVARGSDVNKVHLVSFIIDCSTEQQVNNIIADAVQKGFEDDYASYSEKNKVWSASLNKFLKLNLDEIAANRAKLIPLMPVKGCTPIGWGASVVM